MKDELGNRMKEFYENRTRIYLPRRTYAIIRIDGKAFHTYTRGLERPFDMGLIEDMDATAAYLCKNIQGAKFAFVQSDEISILLTDFDNINTSAWFDGNIQKMASIAASMATAEFNRLRLIRKFKTTVGITGVIMDLFKPAMFDARVFSIPSKTEVGNYFLWRQKDCTRNSIQSVAQSLYSHKELNNKSTNEMQEMIFQKGQNWNDYDAKLKRGRFIDKRTLVLDTIPSDLNKKIVSNEIVEFKRSVWMSIECPIFNQEWEWLYSKIPDNI